MESKIDESLYSRQLFTFGKDGMLSLKETNVLISNINGLGLEIAKCIILGGVKKVILHDVNNVKYEDLGTNYYLTEKDIIKNRALSCHNKLKELNPYVDVTVETEKLTTDLLNKLNVNIIVLVNYKLKDLLEINNFTHNNSIKMISCSTYGLLGQIFCDFGDNFTIKDKDGEEIKTGIITEIKYHEKGTILTTGQNHKLSYDDRIKIYSDLENKKEITDQLIGEHQISRILNSTQILIDKKISNITSNFNLKNVNYEQVKQPMTINFKSLKNSINDDNMSFVHTDYDYDKTEILHSVYCALDEYQNKYGELPKVKNLEDAKKLQELCKNKNDKYQDIINKISMTSRGQLCPMHSVIGSIVAQEIMKASMKKYIPINQWLYFESLNCLPNNYYEKEIINFNLKKDMENYRRYESQILVFGKDFQKKLEENKIFIVGSGAIGCEHLKNFSMMGIGNIIITDMDNIERSNLNRQFLFRSSHIGKSKSLIAGQEVMKINDKIKVTSHTNKVCPETQNIYNQSFFNTIDCVTNALDNVQARLYVDSLCVANNIPLLESGTLGTSGNVQCIIPKLTESYGSQQDPPEESIPLCTLKNFPYMPEHCIQWARELFETTFNCNIKNLIQFIKDEKSFMQIIPAEMSTILPELIKITENIPKSYDDCVRFAINLGNSLYKEQINELLVKYPSDHITEDGNLFWSGTKKCPSIINIDFNTKDELIKNFILSCANLWATVFNIKYENKINLNMIYQNVNIDKKDNNTNSIEDLLKQLRKIKEINKLDKLNIVPIEFEKDDDSNFHIDFIASASNLRSRNYNIKELDKHKVKGIAGKIIPAIATTTSLVSGLVSLELYKVLHNKQKIEDYRNYYINLGISSFQYSEPAEAIKQRIGKMEYTLWDQFEFQNTSLQDVINYFDNKYNINVIGFSVGQVILLSSYMPMKKQNDRKKMKFDQVYKEITGTLPDMPMIVSLIIDNEEEDDDENDNMEILNIKIK